jgi:hypothetical protein
MTQKPVSTNTMLQVSTLDDKRGLDLFHCALQFNIEDTVMRQTKHTSALLNGVASIFKDDDDSNFYDDILNVAFMVQTIQDLIDIIVHSHFEYAEVYNDLVNVYGMVYGITDDGADLVVLRKHAHVLHKNGGYTSLVGYNPKHTRSQRIPVVYAYLNSLAHALPVFLKVHEAV